MTSSLLMALRASVHSRVCRVGAGLLWAALASLEVQAQVNATPFDYTRTSAFTYTAAGLLETETIEPSVAQACVTTKYVYDTYGNRVSATTVNTGPNAQCVNAPSGLSLFDSRASSTTYAAQSGADPVAPAGTFATTASNALGQQEQRVWDARFGVAIKLTGPNALTTTWTLDSFGRKVLETRADATSTLVRYCLIALAVSDTTSNSAGCANPAVGEAPSGAVRYEHTEPQLSSTKIGAYTRVYYDAAGRKLRSITEAFDADTEVSPANPNRLIAQDTSYNPFGAVEIATQPYFMDTKSSLPKAAANGGNAQYGMSRTDYDILGRPVAVYTTDPAVANGASDPIAPRQTGGTEAGVVFNGQSHQASKTSIGYVGLDTVTTTPVTTPTGVVNRVRYEHKNPDGKVVASTDHYGAQVAHQHDAFGNLVATKDALGNQINIDYDVRGRKLKLNDPDAGVTVYCYDALGQLKAQQTSAMRGNHTAPACPAVAGTGTAAPPVAGWTTMAYDLLGRMSERIDADMPGVSSGYKSTWTYDTCAKGIGKLCRSVTSHGVRRKYAYDSLGRPLSARTDVSSGITAISGLTYDGNGRVDSQTFPSGLKVAMAYTAKGYLVALRPVTSLSIPLPAPVSPLTSAEAYWTAKSVNAWGKVEVSGYSNGVNNRSIFEPITGRLLQLSAGTNLASGVVDQRYGWDNAGQLTARIDQLGDGSSGTAVADTFRYDNLGRLKDTTVSGNASPLQRTVELHYNALGMLLYKSDVGSYTYPAQGPATANNVPHGVRSISGTHNAAYTYDTNGSVIAATGGKYRAVAYNSFNLPDSNAGMSGAVVNSVATPKYTWQYDENHQRIKETRLNASGSRVTWSLHPDNLGGLGFEREEGATPSNRHYLSAGGVAIGVIVTTGAMPVLSALDSATDMTVTALANLSATKLEYWHKDHLGSLIATTNQNATVTLRLAYDAFGKRRHTSSAYDVDGNLVIDWSTSPGTPGPDRGYTGHEHLDDLGVIHMNGRIFDPLIARFMQADPLIQDPLNLQNFDRYGYCYNNPLTCTDPSGYGFLSKLFKAVVVIVVAIYAPYLLETYGGFTAGSCDALGQACRSDAAKC